PRAGRGRAAPPAIAPDEPAPMPAGLIADPQIHSASMSVPAAGVSAVRAPAELLAELEFLRDKLARALAA
ncbi:MAG: hypothetical protein ACRC1J_03555, partial [Sandaracinobacteroides sp.]